MIITGAPLDYVACEDVAYWDEICKIMEWTKTHVHCTFHLCWGAYAGLYYHYGIKKTDLAQKLFGIFRDCVLLFVGSFFSLYIRNSSRFAAERFLTAGEYYAYSAALL